MKRLIKAGLAGIAALALAFGVFTGIRAAEFSKITQAEPVTTEQAMALDLALKNQYPQKHEILQPLPYRLAEPQLSVGAESAILIDTASGEILYEKNADEVIPPASMTKLFAMYIVDQEISEGRLAYEDIIQIPPEAWACNMPPHSSLMFLGEGQRVTAEELLLGLSICSGNDAAYALAYTISGSMQAFIERMNLVALELGLAHTHFVEASGYSEENTTTAREMAAFCKIYIEQHPESLERFHSVESFTYPKQRNLAPGDALQNQDFSNGLPRHITMPITQKNTNPLLGRLAGCDGLKTGYINESGYNLALTASRNGTRFLSVTMRGKGKSTAEGQAGRIHDGTQLMEYAFGSFGDYHNQFAETELTIKTYGATKKAVKLVPAYKKEVCCVPFLTGNSIAENLASVRTQINLPGQLSGQIMQAQQYGSITLTLEGYVIEEIPLVADRSLNQAGFITRLADKIISRSTGSNPQ